MFNSPRPVGVFALAFGLVLGVAGGVAVASIEPGPQNLDAAAVVRQRMLTSGVEGGLVVRFGATDGKLTAALRVGDTYLVHGLALDRASADKARRHIQSLGLYGPVAVDTWSGGRLPYADNLVNFFFAEHLHGLPMDEIMRVLAPGGVACTQHDGEWTKTVKPRPASIDDWTHALYDASNNAVSRDTVVGPPQHLQWVAGPRNARHHEALASTSVVVSAGGRLFYVVDEAPAASILLPAQWRLVARDAFNGVLLWKRPVATWQPYLWPAQNGPPSLSRRLVAQGDRVYVTLGLDAPVTALSAAMGLTVTTYEGTKGTEEILLRGPEKGDKSNLPRSGPEGASHKLDLSPFSGVLYLVVGPGEAAQRPAPKPPRSKTVMAVEAGGGRVLWKRSDVRPLPMSLAVGGDRVFWLAPDAVVCVDAKTGADAWRTKRQVARQRPSWSAPTLVVQGDVVLCADRRPTPVPDVDEITGKRMPRWLAQGGGAGDLVAYEAKTGRQLWTAGCGETYHSQIDVLVGDGLVWLGQSRARQGPDYTVARDLLTGEIKRRISPGRAFDTTMPHHRCYRDRATARYLVTGRTGVEFVDLQTGKARRHHWVRGVCQYGVIPANGLLYAPPHSCACYIEAKLTGFNALAPAAKPESGDSQPKQDAERSRLQRGPAYDEIPNPKSQIPNADDWPTYRHDAARSGRTPATVPVDLKCAWEASPGGRLSSPVIAGGRVLVASVDAHTVCALDAAAGKPLWRYTAAARVDSPPTVAGPLAVFGSADGWVHCVRASDGHLVWRYRAAPEQRRVVANDQLESAWPAHGSVLVRDGAVYCAAGRSSYLDGGIRLVRLDLRTGEKLSEQCLYSREARTGEQPGEPIMFEMPGALPDVLSCDGKLVYMRHLAFDPKDLAPRKAPAHLYSPAGFLNDDWWHRTYWIYGEHFYCGYIGWYFAGRETPAGRLLVVDDGAIYGFGYKPQSYRGARERHYHLFAIDRGKVPPQPAPDYARANRDYPQRGAGKFVTPLKWKRDVPLLGRALVLAGDTLFLAGPPAEALQSTPAYDGARGAMLCAVSAADGKTLAGYRLPALPVFDGLAAAHGRLYMTMHDGRVLCLGEGRSTPGGKQLQRLHTAKP